MYLGFDVLAGGFQRRVHMRQEGNHRGVGRGVGRNFRCDDGILVHLHVFGAVLFELLGQRFGQFGLAGRAGNFVRFVAGLGIVRDVLGKAFGQLFFGLGLIVAGDGFPIHILRRSRKRQKRSGRQRGGFKEFVH